MLNLALMPARLLFDSDCVQEIPDDGLCHHLVVCIKISVFLKHTGAIKKGPTKGDLFPDSKSAGPFSLA